MLLMTSPSMIRQIQGCRYISYTMAAVDTETRQNHASSVTFS